MFPDTKRRGWVGHQCEGVGHGDIKLTPAAVGNNTEGAIKKESPNATWLLPATAIGGEGGCTFSTNFGGDFRE